MFNSNYGSISHRFDIFDFEKYCDLEIWVRGHSRSSKTSGQNWKPCLVPVKILSDIRSKPTTSAGAYFHQKTTRRRPINYNPLSPYLQSILLLRLILKQLDDLKVNSAVRNLYESNILEKAWHLIRNYYAIISVNRKIILITVTKLNDYLWSRLVMTLCVA